jgi:uncharacterized membrane protein
MSFHYTRTQFLASLMLLVATVCIWSLQIRTLLDDRSLHSQLWPADIHAAVVPLLGGSTTRSLLSGYRFSLPWPPVLVRCLVATAVAILLHTALSYRQHKLHVPNLPRRLTNTIKYTAAAIRPAAAFAIIWLILWNFAPLLPSDSLTQFLITASPPTFGLSLALALAGLASPPAPTNASPLPLPFATESTPAVAAVPHGMLRKNAPILVLLIAAAGWQYISFQMNTRLYNNLLVPHGDSAMYEEHLWNVWHGKGFRSYLDQGLFLGEHIQVIHLLLLPLHLLWPHYLLLEWTSTACLAACAFPIHAITLRHSGCRRAALWMAIAWLFYTPMHFLDIAIDLKTLRPSCYGLFALFLAIDFAERKRRGISSICFLLALLTQEDFALITGPVGLVLALAEFRLHAPQRDPKQLRWASALAATSVAWVLLAVLVVIPAFRGGEVVHYSRYFGDLGRSPSELIAATFSQPAKVASVIFSSRTMLYIVLLAGPIAFLPLKSPLRLSAGLATFTMLSLIQLGSDQNGTATELPPIPFHHFHAPLLPVLFWAAAAGLKNTQRTPTPPNSSENSRAAGLSHARPHYIFSILSRLSSLPQTLCDSPAATARLACITAACTATTGSLMPCGTAFWSRESPFGWRQLYAPGTRGTELENIIRQLPTTARIASTDFVHTRLTHFERSYDYSDYLRAVNNYRPGVPADTDFIIIDTTHRYSSIRSASQVPELQPQPTTKNDSLPTAPDNTSRQSSPWELLPQLSRGGFLVLHRRNSRFPAPDADLLPNPSPETIRKNIDLPSRNEGSP